MKLLHEIARALYTEDCCNDCLLKKVAFLIKKNKNCDEQIKNELLRIVDNKFMSDAGKIEALILYVDEHDY